MPNRYAVASVNVIGTDCGNRTTHTKSLPCHPTVSDALIAWGYRMAFLILSAHQAKVQRLADALLTHRRVSGEEISDLLGRNGSNGR